jgi:hypothetical protein
MYANRRAQPPTKKAQALKLIPPTPVKEVELEEEDDLVFVETYKKPGSSSSSGGSDKTLVTGGDPLEDAAERARRKSLQFAREL